MQLWKGPCAQEWAESSRKTYKARTAHLSCAWCAGPPRTLVPCTGRGLQSPPGRPDSALAFPSHKHECPDFLMPSFSLLSDTSPGFFPTQECHFTCFERVGLWEEDLQRPFLSGSRQPELCAVSAEMITWFGLLVCGFGVLQWLTLVC